MPNFTNNSDGVNNIKITKKDLHRVRAFPNDTFNDGNRTCAMQALMDGYSDVIIKLVKNDKINFNVKDKQGRSIMHYAIKNKNKDLIKLLIKKRVSINIRDAKGRTPIFQYFNKKGKSDIDLDFARWLVDNGADANVNDNKGNLPLHIAAKEHSVNVISFLLDVTKQPDKSNYTGWRPIHYAVEKNDLAVVQKILHHRIDILATDNHGGNILHHALENKNDDIIKFLVKETKAVKMLNKQDIDKKQTPFQKAICNKKIDVVHQMISLGADVNKKDGNGDSPLTLSIKGKTAKMTEMLLSFGADIFNEPVLYESIFSYGDDSNSLFNILMEYSPDVDFPNSVGRTPLMRAFECGKGDIAQKLLDAGADPSKLSKDKKNVLFFISGSCSDDIIRELIKEGADVGHIAENGNTVLHEMVIGTYNVDHVKILIENGADINVPDKYGRVLLHHILGYNADIELVKWLIDNGADINIKTEDKVTILHMVSGSYGAHEGLLQKIIDMDDGDINRADDGGNTALHHAVREDRAENVKILLDNGADPQIENKYHESPILLSQRYFNKDVAKVFIEFEKKKSKGISDKFNKKPSNQNNKKPPKGFGGGFIV